MIRISKFSTLSVLINTNHANGVVYMLRQSGIICLMGDYRTIRLYCGKMVVYEIQLYEDTKVHNTSKLYMVVLPLCEIHTKWGQVSLIRLLPSTIYKNTKNIKRTLFGWAKIKTRTRELCRKTSKQTLRNTFSRGPPLYYLQKL